MSGPSRRRERSATVSSGTLIQPQRSATQTPVDASGASVASSSARQEQMQEATLAAESALRRYQAESQPASATFPYQILRRPAPQENLRHAGATVTGSLQRIPEVIPEISSGEGAPRPSQTMPLALRAGVQASAHGRSISMEDHYRALPRNFDPVTGTKQPAKAGSGRPSLPYIFEPLTSPQPPRGVFPNPHQTSGPSDSNLSTAQLQRRASQEMQSPLLTRHSSSFGPGQRNDRQPYIQVRQPERDIPPTPPLGQHAWSQTMPLTITRSRQAQVAQVAQAVASHIESNSSTWSSESESQPTPTASSVAAIRERNAQLEATLLPVQLTLPSTFSSSSTFASAQNVVSLIAGARFGAPTVQEPRETPMVAMSAAEVASIKASAAPFAPAKSSNLSAPPIRSDSNDTSHSGETIALPDGTQIPTVRTDFQNLKRISLPKPVVESSSAVAAKQGLHSVGGHILSRADPKIVPRNDGSSRAIYSPTPQTLANARRQSTLLQVPKGSTAAIGAGGEERIPSPLSASAEAPQAPQIPQSLKFRNSAPSLGTLPTEEQPAAAPEMRKPQPNAQAQGEKSVSGTTQAKSDDTDVRRRDNAENVGFRNDPRRNTFGELAPSMLEEANRKLFHYQMQQLEKDAREKGVGSSRQLVPALRAQESAAKVEKKAEEAPATTSSIMRRESSASQRSRRDSIGSATTALDSPTNDEFQPSVHRQANTGSSKANRGTARATVAPPSDVQEVAEPEEIEAAYSEEGTEFEEQDGSNDLSFDKRVPFVVDTYAHNEDEDSDARALRNGGNRSEFRFIPISSVKAGKARRPRTRDTRVSFRSNPSHIEQQRPGSRQHGAAPACRQCFRAGFDCAMNLQLGEGTAARKAFQDFVAAGGLNAFSIRDGAANRTVQRPTAGSLVDSQAERGGSITVGEALGRNYVDKLGEVAFGESALSRPVTRGMYNELLEEKQEQERRKQLLSEHKPWAADVEDDIDLAKHQQQQRQSAERVKRSLSNGHKDRRLSQMTLQDGLDEDQVEAIEDDARQVLLNNVRGSGSRKIRDLEEGEIVDIDPADYVDEHDFDEDEDDAGSSASSESDIVTWADRWSAWAKLRQLLAYWIYIFALQALASGYNNTVPRIIADESASSASAFLLQLGGLAYNGSQGGGLFFANLIVGFGRQRITLFSLVAVGVVCAIAGFVHNVTSILACQSVLGLLSGLVIFLGFATVMDLFATSKGRVFGTGSIALFIVGGQLLGPWISKVVLELLTWSWTYWLTLIVAAVLIVYIGVATRETASFVLFRREALRLKRTGQGWTPESQVETKPKQMFADDLARPIRLMKYNAFLALMAVSIAGLSGMYMFLFSGLQGVFARVHGLTSTNAALATMISAVSGLIGGVVAIYLIIPRKGSQNSSGFSTKARPLYLDEKGRIDTRRPLRAKTESLLVPAILATAVFSFALYTLALTSSFATTWFFTAFGIVLATSSLVVVAVSMMQYVMDGYSPPRRVVLRDVIAREDVSTPTLLQEEDVDRFTSYSRRTSGRLAAARFSGGPPGRHGRSEHDELPKGSGESPDWEAWLDAGESVTTTRDKRWLDETALAAVTAVASLLFTVCSVLSSTALQAFGKLSFGAFSVIFASASLLILLALFCVFSYGAKPRATSLVMLDEADSGRAHSRRAAQREKRAVSRRRSLSLPQTTGKETLLRGGVLKKLASALGYRPLSADDTEIYRRSSVQPVPPSQTERRARTPAPRPLMQESDRQTAATATAEGRRELWLARFIANRDSKNTAPVPTPAPAQAIQLNEATEARRGAKAFKRWGGVMLGLQESRDPIGRTLIGTSSLPVNLNNSGTDAGVYSSPPHQLHPLSPPPRAQPRAGISVQSPPAQDGFEIVHFQGSPSLQKGKAENEEEARPYTPVMTRKSVDVTRSKIMARSHSQPLGLYAQGQSQSPNQRLGQKFGLGIQS
ncbi:uncharacterized protein MEPE_02805 [Melanopsichium pennsylvanicum]|uniref:Major facilitator superfamily (MFS) profile domain-containing protein n=2 Tax=Melanopsichium pennsylvanicum TaxID=63383 RepID=A0AAJ4XKR6_9BASI|nr:cycloheximide resistance protein [Melanopsichium pennsylvanicum 4]SNX84097.1 uncharacterized protein MEPE_02805 [Melanopsichium pennsylvanicum]